MFRKLTALLAALLCAFLLIVPASAHPGDLDENGGHYNRSTGEYHYHHGYPAHQHTNGKCPYDYDDKTGQNSGDSPNSGSQNPVYDSSPSQKNSDSFGKIVKSIVSAVLWLLGFSATVCFWWVMIKAFLPEKKPSSCPPEPPPPPQRGRQSSVSLDSVSFYGPRDLSLSIAQTIIASAISRGLSWVVPDSTLISSFAYDETCRILFIRMQSGPLFLYRNVPANIFDLFLSASDTDLFYRAFIKDVYPSRDIHCSALPDEPPLS